MSRLENHKVSITAKENLLSYSHRANLAKTLDLRFDPVGSKITMNRFTGSLM